MKTLVKSENVLSATKAVVRDAVDSVRARARRGGPDLDARQFTTLESIRRDGFAVVSDYWSRDKALAIRDKLEPYVAQSENRDYDEGAYARFHTQREYDEAVGRIYHIDKLVPNLAAFRFDPWVLQLVDAYYGLPFHSRVLMFQHNSCSNANTRGYHVDAFMREFKAFLYLDDVDEGNGPFTFLRGSHRSHLTRLRKQVVGNAQGSNYTFYPEDLRADLKNEVMLCAPAGSLILADVRGFHRGSPQLERSRSVLVNYILREQGDVFLDK